MIGIYNLILLAKPFSIQMTFLETEKCVSWRCIGMLWCAGVLLIKYSEGRYWLRILYDEMLEKLYQFCKKLH